MIVIMGLLVWGDMIIFGIIINFFIFARVS